MARVAAAVALLPFGAEVSLVPAAPAGGNFGAVAFAAGLAVARDFGGAQPGQALLHVFGPWEAE